MNKSEYLTRLRIELIGIPTSEIADIVRDQEEHIRDATSSGRSEADVLNSLGSPEELARSIKAELKYEKVSAQLQNAADNNSLTAGLTGAFKVVIALMILAPFNLIFVLGPFIALMSLLFVGWVMAVASILAMLALLLIFFGVFIIPGAHFAVSAALFFLVLSGLFGSVLFIIVMNVLTKFVFKGVLSYLRWNLNFIRKRASVDSQSQSNLKSVSVQG